MKKISSLSEEELSVIRVQKESGFDTERFQNEIKTRVDAIAALPRRMERPVVARDEFNVEALLVQVYGDVDAHTLQNAARRVREELQAHPRITKMTLFGLRSREIRIEVDDERLRSAGMTVREVAEAIERASLDYRTGSIENDAGRIVIHADNKALRREDFEAIPLQTLPDGARLSIEDAAEVIDGFEEGRAFARFQGAPSVGMMIYTSRKGHLIEVSEACREVIETIRPLLPEGVRVDAWGESSVYMKARLSLLATNAWQGLLIVFGLLALFLHVRLAFWVAMGVPISLAGALVVMGDRFLGCSLNDITTFGMILSLGLLVDDAIVVGESVFEARQRTADPVQGAVQGVNRVSTAAVFGCFTSVAAFYPLMLIDNELGKIFAGFSVVVIASLFASMLESKLILPAHLAAARLDAPASGGALSRWWGRIQSLAHRALAFINERLYQPMLSRALRHRYASLAIFITVAVCGVSMVFNGWVRTVFFPEVPGQIILVRLEMKQGGPLHLTEANITAIERAAESLNAEAMAEFGVDQPPIARIMTALTGPFSAEIYVELRPEKSRVLETMETVRRWREKVGVLEGVDELRFSGSLETGGGFVVELAARDEAVLRDAVRRFSSALGRLEGVHDVRDDLQRGGSRIRLRLKPEAQHLGLTAADLASQIGDAFGGLEVQRVQRDGEEVKVIVKYRERRRRHIRDLLDTRIRTSRGEWLPLALAARIETESVPSLVHRENGRRVVQVSASLDKERISPGEAFDWMQKNVAPELQRLHPGLAIRGAGELEEIGDLRAGIKRALVMILLLIYVLLAAPLKSYWQPLVIMSVIPFGFVGAVIGHRIAGFPLSILSFFGMLAVMGVVVNDSLVMLTRFNQVRAAGVSLHSSLVKAGGGRFRAIILTTVTTVCGLTPLLSETSEQAQYLIPAAISLAWGELFATPITLFIIPVLIHIAHDGISFFKRNKNRAAAGRSPRESGVPT